MLGFTINVPIRDVDSADVKNAFASAYGYRETIDLGNGILEPNPVSKEQFVTSCCTQFLLSILKAYTVESAEAQARNEAIAAASGQKSGGGLADILGSIDPKMIMSLMGGAKNGKQLKKAKGGAWTPSDVPADAFYYAFKMGERKSEEYYIADMLSDELGKEKSSVLYLKLKKELQLVTDINAYILGSLDQGLFIISGKMMNGKSMDELDSALWEVLDVFKLNPITDQELKRLKLKIRTSKEFQEQGLLNRTMNLAYYELLGDANGINEEHEIYNAIEVEHLQELSKHLFVKENCSLLQIKATQSHE